jgi:hypothetical protein
VTAAIYGQEGAIATIYTLVLRNSRWRKFFLARAESLVKHVDTHPHILEEIVAPFLAGKTLSKDPLKSFMAWQLLIIGNDAYRFTGLGRRAMTRVLELAERNQHFATLIFARPAGERIRFQHLNLALEFPVFRRLALPAEVYVTNGPDQRTNLRALVRQHLPDELVEIPEEDARYGYGVVANIPPTMPAVFDWARAAALYVLWMGARPLVCGQKYLHFGSS